MQLSHLSQAASSRSGEGRNKADAREIPMHFPGDVEEGQRPQLKSGFKQENQAIWGEAGSSLDMRRLQNSSSVSLQSQAESRNSHSKIVPPVESESHDFGARSKWSLPVLSRSFHETSHRHPRTFWISIAIVIMALLTALLATVLVLTHVHRTHGSQDFTVDLGVDLGYSKYVGEQAVDNNIVKWLGIRFAAPPVGNNRFRAPQPPAVDGQTYHANKSGDICISTPSTKGVPGGYSEDCLFLNVYAPVDNSKSHPVFVYIQGGGLNSNASPNMNGASLIEAGDHDMIVVDFNYRVGPWGFLASKEVQANGDLNAGFLDQRMALQWVQKYIHLFGGDPKRVVLGGASAGAGSIDFHLSAYGGRNDGLFIAVAAESQSWGEILRVSEAQYQYDGLVQRSGCDGTSSTLACLRSLSIDALAKANTGNTPIPGGDGGSPIFAFSAVIDGTMVQDQTYNAFANGRYIKVPAIMGDATNEGTIFTPRSPMNNYTDVNTFLRNNFVKLNAAQLAQIDHLYPLAEIFSGVGAGPYWRTAANAYGDLRYTCPSLWLATIFNRDAQNVYVYQWDVASASNIANGLGVTHVSESGSVWGSANKLPASALNPLLQGYWASFIRTGGDPNKLRLAGSPTWTTLGGQSMLDTNMVKMHFPNDPSQAGMMKLPADQVTRCQYLNDIGGALAQ